MKTFMKPLNAFIIVISMISLFSCSNDDDVLILPPEPTTQELLANKWYLEKRVNTSTTPPTTYEANDCEKNTYFDFNNDGIIIAESFGLNGGNCESLSLESGTYSLNNNEDQIIITDSGSTQIVNILTLSSTELVISFNTTEIHFMR
ncbi:lipocalin family protein [Corallibacter sp.]|uniref:lipocalin family protein n=1 Tax=Corallibacter sp. TaxID=2038084 RepID=UPI003AB2851A